MQTTKELEATWEVTTRLSDHYLACVTVMELYYILSFNCNNRPTVYMFCVYRNSSIYSSS